MVDFKIISKPTAISFDCPHCESDQEIKWNKINPPGYWGDKWDPVTCPDCGREVILDDWEYD